ncbi:two-component system sensor histidine kinase YesM [Paenibacillus phyllosphaerae]|uniref:histidine kinase n=1 Tax=Paenibacillus phyllosphaerae TaxID=274593 RepID=A0A7W5B1V1_9BACL|nr:sensor histidine kinase [Paenibacillus phyllosphaerae]MBB3112823.1 two-component system sensor histidine kinase YesM [Paenibacillus phyllosphaerae]
MAIGKLWRSVIDPFRRSIRNRLILTMILLSVIPTLAVTVLAAENNRRTIEAEVIDTNLSNMKWTGVYLGDQFAQLNNLIYTMLISPSMNAYLMPVDDAQEPLDFAAQRTILDTLTSLFYTAGNHVIGVEMYLKGRSSLITVNASQSDIDTVSEIPPIYANLFEENKDFSIDNSSEDEGRFRLIRSINRFENQEKLGGIALTVQWGIFDQTLDLLGRGEDQAVLIADSDGRILYNPSGVEASDEVTAVIAKQTEGPGYVQTTHSYVFTNTIDPVGLKLVTIIPAGVIDHSARSTARYGLIIGIISAAVSLFIAFAIAWKTARPIVTLARSMQGLNLIREQEKTLVKRVDEIGLLENRLQQMAARIREHIKVEYSINLERKTAELKALQAQINPHFLQNTLQLIGSMVFSKQPAESYEVIRSLSDMFRYVIREPGDLAMLKAEIGHLNNYMLIQEKRYTSRLRYTLDVEEAAMRSLLPKLTLQPIVENAFMHGLETKKGSWELSVTAAVVMDDVVIQIRDNGAGMPPKRLTDLRERLSSYRGQVWTHGERIGLNNVASRLKMHFGDEYGIKVDSEAGIGTVVTVRIPHGIGGEEA